MQRLDPNASIRPSSEANGYLKVLVENKAFRRMVDAYIFAAAYAINQNIDISFITTKKGHEIITFNSIDPEIRLSIEAGIHRLCKQNGIPQPQDSQEVFDLFTKYAEAGLKKLKERWSGKIGNQIQNDICRIINSKP